MMLVNYTEVNLNSCKIYPKSIPSGPKFNQNGAKERSESDLGNKSRERPARDRNARHFGATWAILGAIWYPAGRQGALQIEHFGTKLPKNQ